MVRCLKDITSVLKRVQTQIVKMNNNNNDDDKSNERTPIVHVVETDIACEIRDNAVETYESQ